MLDGVFGYRLVQLGAFGDAFDYLDNCPIRHRILIADKPCAGIENIVAETRRLPLASDSIDAALLIHALDFSPDPRQVLREVERVLIADGRVVIVGFNPYSLWGLWRLVARWRGDVPWSGHFLSYPRLNDWLTLMGFAVESMDVMEFRPPVRGQGLDAVERFGKQMWPMLAGVYAIRAVKRVSRLTPLKQPWRRPRLLGPRAIEPAARHPFPRA